MKVFGYKIFSAIYESDNSIVYRGQREENNQPVIFKLLKGEYPTPEAIARHKLEYEITKTLNISGVVKVYGLEKYQNSFVMLLEDFGAESLRILMNSHKFTLTEFLLIAIQITEILGEIHKKNVIHKDINTSNIVFNPLTEQLKIIDFGVSTILSRENPTFSNSNVLEGTLAYMSPEQTGRMNRMVDYRTDFYSLGVTFYELLTYQLPFTSDEPMELVHCHLAKQPISPHELEPSIPKIVADIVLKLLSKTAEERYQSAYGLKLDLQLCLEQLKANNYISCFPLAQYDLSSQLQIPQKLYGRQGEIETLLAAFERISGRINKKTPRAEMMLVSGYSGIGKSALVQEINKPLTRQRGYFIFGKFDQFQRNIPYSAIIQAFSELIRHLLTETESQIIVWRQKLLEVLGKNGQIVIDVIPELELIIGKQPAVTALPATESQNRFNLVFQKFISIFAQAQHPLVIFLDDLQWADLASLKFIQILMVSPGSEYLLLIGAYRDREVSPSHPLILAIDEIKKFEVIVNNIYLKPLELHTVNELISDTINCSLEKAEPLAELVFEKTNGNPFFINELLKYLYTHKLLNFNFNLGCWQWDLQQTQATPIAENVVILMADKIKSLQDKTQQVLKLAACLGNQFDLQTLSFVYEKSEFETATQLWEAIKEGLIIPIGNNFKFVQLEIADKHEKVVYKFVHDRVQQAAYLLIPEAQKQSIHLHIGQILLKNISPQALNEKIFDVVNQLNIGSVLLKKQQQRDELAELNLVAGKKAKAAAAYQSAFIYLKQGLELIAANSWIFHYNITLNLHIEAAEAAYFCGDFEEMERLVNLVLHSSDVLLDKVKVYDVRISAYIAQQRLKEAIDTGLLVLKLLGENLPKKPNVFDILLYLQRIKLSLLGRRIENLIKLPVMASPSKIAALRILNSINSATYATDPNLFVIIHLKGMALSIKYGNCLLSPANYANSAIIFSGIFGDIELGYQLSNLALNLLELSNAQEVRSKTLFLVNTFVKIWRQHVKQTLQPLLDGYLSGVEVGDLEYAAYCAIAYSYHSLWIGNELTACEKELAKYSDFIKKFKQERFLQMLNLTWQLCLNLMGKSENPCYLIGEAFDESKRLPIDIQANDNQSVFNISIYKLGLCYLFEDYEQGLKYATLIQKYLNSGRGLLSYSLFFFYHSLLLLVVYPTVPSSQKKSLFSQINANQKEMQKWANSAPMNFLHKFYLVEAEWYRVKGEDAKAIDNYDRAISLAKENEYLNDEALACELAAKFYLSKAKTLSAKTYMQEAHYCYLKWGAKAKVKDIELKYPQLLTNLSASRRLTDKNSHSTYISSDNLPKEVLDLATITKASQAISSEIVLEKLMAKLMQIMIENTGAQSGFLILEVEGQLLIKASGTVDENESKYLNETDPNLNSNISEVYLPLSIINYVTRTQETVVLNDATKEGLFTSDRYIKEQQIKSILCVPLISQGKVISIVYLENNLSTDIFNSDRLEIVKLLCAQAAISLENAQLYAEKEEYAQTLEQKVAERTAELEKANQKLHRLATLDSLTQVANRRRFDEYILQEWGRLAREQQPLSLILCDVDYFKKYNDCYGHQGGDECLQQVALAITHAIKRPADLVARYGGEEFAVILPNTNAEGAVAVVKAIKKEIHQLEIPHSQSKVSQYVTLSLGVSSIVPTHNLSPKNLIATTDKALYEAKKQGRDRFVLKN